MKKYISRKEFIRLSAIGAMAIPSLGYIGCKGKQAESKPKDTNDVQEFKYADWMGIQVFGLRELLVENPQKVFKDLAAMGIKNIELFDPATLNTYVPIIKDLGMTALSTHFLPGYISGKWDTVKKIGMAPPADYHFENIVDDCATNGINYLGIAIMMPEERQSLDDYRRFAELTNQHAEISKKAGVQLYYHNHSFEFKPTEGAIPFDEMLTVFDSDLVKIELDVFWATIAHNDPLSWIDKLGDQLLFLHMKDLKVNTPLDYTVFDVDNAAFLEIGDGIIDYKQIMKACKEAGVQYAFLDQDHTAMDKMESVKKSLEYIKRLGI
ncbi:MAG: sugar phosphate isomerase/epimerase [Maribacter sp.]